MSRGASAQKRSHWRERFRRFARSKLSVTEFCRQERDRRDPTGHVDRRRSLSVGSRAAEAHGNRINFGRVDDDATTTDRVLRDSIGFLFPFQILWKPFGSY